MDIAGELVMSNWSAVSSYATAGDPPKPMASAKEPDVLPKAKRKEKPRKPTQHQPAIDPEQAAALLKVSQATLDLTS